MMMNKSFILVLGSHLSSTHCPELTQKLSDIYFLNFLTRHVVFLKNQRSFSLAAAWRKEKEDFVVKYGIYDRRKVLRNCRVVGSRWMWMAEDTKLGID